MAQSQPLWHSLTREQALQFLHVDPKAGLSLQQVRARQREFGPNLFGEIKGVKTWEIFVAQFRNVVMVLLLIAAAISVITADYLDALAILAAILLSVVIGFVTESRAERALQALRKLSTPTARVVRAGNEEEVPTSDLVPGDILILSAGSRIPADARLLEEDDLTVDQAPLTGESEWVGKQVDPVPADTTLPDRTNMVYLGTSVTGGHAGAVVVATGERTELGRIGRLIAETPHEVTPLEVAVEGLGRRLVWIVIGAAAIVTAVGIWRQIPLGLMVETGVTLAIAAVPEGLPTVTTVALAWGLQRLVRRHAIVRRLSAVETLGSTTVICADKTGTLTVGVMTVTDYRLDSEEVRVTGTGYRPEGSFLEDAKEIDPLAHPRLRLALVIGALCNNATLERDEEAGWHGHGDPVEIALLVAAAKAGLNRAELASEYPRRGEIPFDEKRKRMTTFHDTPEGGIIAFVKGAPDVVSAACSMIYAVEGEQPLGEKEREEIEERNRQMADRGLRVLALAYRRKPEVMADEAVESGLTYVGLVGMSDPVRPHTKEAIKECIQAGIRPIMITGDQKRTAAAVAAELGLPKTDSVRAVEVKELAALTGPEAAELVRKVSVFARATPQDKLEIVRVLEAGDEIVAMTGDGINDAPALKAAHIGIAMGEHAADVAKEAADMIITDADFSTIVVAVEQGRVIYANIRRAFRFLLTASFGAILAILIAVVAGTGLPLLPLQILWLNLIVHVFPAIALALEPGEPDIMKAPPRNPKEPILPVRLLGSIVWRSLLIAAGTIMAFVFALRIYPLDHRAITVALATLGFALMFHMFNSRSEGFLLRPGQRWDNPYVWLAFVIALLLQLFAIYAPPMQAILRTAPLSLQDWVIVLVWSVIPAILVEFSKLIWPVTYQSRIQSRGG